MSDAFAIDPNEISADEFAGLVANTPDDQVETLIRATGTKKVLDRIFHVMQERFLPDKARGVDLKIQFFVKDLEEEFPYAVSISNGRCDISPTTEEDPRVTLTADLVPFIKLVSGQADGVQLFFKGALKVSGDIMFAQRIMSFFDRPTPTPAS